jgi:Transposase DDE domain
MGSSARARKAKAKPARRPAHAPLTNGQQLRALRDWLLPDASIFAPLRFHGNTKWTPAALVWMALCWAWSDARFVTDAFAQARTACQQLDGALPVTTYQGLLAALVTWTPALLPVLFALLQRRMQEIGGRFWRIEGWLAIAFDGSRSTAPRTKANEAALCAPNYGRGKTATYRKKKGKGRRRRKGAAKPAQPQEPQAWVTLMWHMGLRLPWCWRLGPSNASERQHVLDMAQAQAFPRRTLFCGDAGFIGYPLWSCLLARGADFLVRVGANVQLLTAQAVCRFEKRGRDLLVYCWPKAALHAGQAPLRLRLVQVQLGRTKVWLLTSVLDRQRLPLQAMRRLYQRRWGVEVEFRGLKQTLDRAKLRCRNDRRLLVELDWSILAMAVAELLALKEQLARRPPQAAGRGRGGDPAKRSLANTMRALRGCLGQLREVPAEGEDLLSRLRAAVTDSYMRTAPKRARYRPPNPDKKPLGDPKLRPLTPQERKRLQRAKAGKAS